jgi:hypothetical protein
MGAVNRGCLLHENHFSTFITFDPDLAKAADLGESALLGPISGIASTDAVDHDGEVVDQDGLDWSLFTKGGSFRPVPLTYEHPFTVKDTIGEATSIEIVERDGRKATKITGNLFLSDPKGREIWDKIVTWKKSGSQLRLGFSVEGKVVQRNGNKIAKARVHSIAISQFPRNYEAWLEPLAASLLDQIKAEYTLTPIANLAQKAETVGYPDQSAGEGGLDKVVPQKQTRKVSTASWVSEKDAAAVAVAKQFPELSWSRCCGLAEMIRTMLGSSKEN